MISNRTSKILRGIAILMVIASHYAGNMFVEPLRPQAKEFVSTWGVFGVDIFFMLSGYGLVKSEKKGGITLKFVVNRLLGCYVPYILIVGFIELSTDGFADLESFKNFLIGYSYWYIYVQMALYIIFIIAYKIGRFKELLLTIGVVLFVYWLSSAGRASFWIVSDGAFLIGAYFATVDEKLPKVFEKWYSKLVAFAITLGATYGFNIIYKSNGSIAMEMHRSMAFTCAVLVLCTMVDYKSVILATLGRYSIYIYLLHIYLFWKFILMHEAWGYTKSAVITGIISLFICVATGFSIEWNINRIRKKFEGKNE